MREVLARVSQDPPSIECQMIGTTRSGYCSLKLNRAGARAMAEDLGLEAGTADLDDPAVIPIAAAEGAAGCLSPEVFGSADGLSAYWIGGRPDVLELEDGGQFEYLMLFLDPDSGQACMQVSYAYG